MSVQDTVRRSYDALGQDVHDDLEAIRRFAKDRGFAVVDIVTADSLNYTHPHLTLEQRERVVQHIAEQRLFDVRKDSGTLANYLKCRYHLINETVIELQATGVLPEDTQMDGDARILMYLTKLNDHLDGIIRRYPLPEDLTNPELDRKLDQRGMRIHYVFKHNITEPLRALIDAVDPDAIDSEAVERAAAWLDRFLNDPRFDAFLQRVYQNIGYRKANALYKLVMGTRDYLLSNA